MTTHNNDLAITLEIVDLIAKSGQFLHCQLGAGRYKLLSILLENERIAQKQLQEMLSIRSGTISEIIAKLEAEGLVEKEKSLKDARKIMLHITSKGAAETKKVQCEFENRVGQMLYGLSEAEKKNLLYGLETVQKNLHGENAV